MEKRPLFVLIREIFKCIAKKHGPLNINVIGKKMKIEKVVCPEDPSDTYEEETETFMDELNENHKVDHHGDDGGAEIISFRGIKK